MILEFNYLLFYIPQSLFVLISNKKKISIEAHVFVPWKFLEAVAIRIQQNQKEPTLFESGFIGQIYYLMFEEIARHLSVV